MLLKDVDCPLCDGKGFETVHNFDTNEMENMDCTYCWGAEKVDIDEKIYKEIKKEVEDIDDPPI